MSKIIVLGGSGSLGKHVVEQAIGAAHDVSVIVRTPSKLPEAWRNKVQIFQADIATIPIDQLGANLAQYDAVINAAGLVSDGARFVTLFAHVVDSLETIDPSKRPVTWFMAGAGLLDIGNTKRRALDLPFIKKTYWPHSENLKRLEASSLDFRLLCPGPMVEGPAIGVTNMRVALDHLPVLMPGAVKFLPDLMLVPLFASRVPELIIPFADAAALILSNLEPKGAMSRRRVGLALPKGMRGKKDRWRAKAPAE